MDKPKIENSNELIKILKSDEELKDGQWKELGDFLSGIIGSEQLDKICTAVTEELGEDIEKVSRTDRRGKLLAKLEEVAEFV